MVIRFSNIEVMQAKADEPLPQKQPLNPIEQNLDEDPFIPPENHYSKLIVFVVFLAAIPFFAIWTALLAVCLPLKLYNVISSRPIHLINAFYSEYYAVASVISRFFCGAQYAFAPGEGRPILLVHGFLHNASGWHDQIERLKKENLGPIYTINLGNGSLGSLFWSIRHYARQVKEMADRIELETGRRDIVLVGHSMGGVVSSLACPENVTDIITIGSPLWGSKLANHFGTGLNVPEMAIDSELLGEVRAKIQETQQRIHHHHISSEADLLVSRDSALMDEESEDNVVFKDLGHLGLMISDRVGDKLVEWIRA